MDLNSRLAESRKVKSQTVEERTSDVHMGRALLTIVVIHVIAVAFMYLKSSFKKHTSIEFDVKNNGDSFEISTEHLKNFDPKTQKQIVRELLIKTIGHEGKYQANLESHNYQVLLTDWKVIQLKSLEKTEPAPSIESEQVERGNTPEVSGAVPRSTAKEIAPAK